MVEKASLSEELARNIITSQQRSYVSSFMV